MADDARPTSGDLYHKAMGDITEGVVKFNKDLSNHHTVLSRPVTGADGTQSRGRFSWETMPSDHPRNDPYWTDPHFTDEGYNDHFGPDRYQLRHDPWSLGDPGPEGPGSGDPGGPGGFGAGPG